MVSAPPALAPRSSHSHTSSNNGWVVAGEPGPNLVRLYFSIALCILLCGLVTWIQVVRYWLISYRRATVLIRSYVWITISDGATVLMYCFFALAGIIHPGLPSEAWWCQLTAFVSMAVSYSLSCAYIAVSVATLAFVRQKKDGSVLARFVHALSASGWVMGFGISIMFVQRGQLGSYRNLYCMVPLDKYDSFTIGLAFAFVGLTHVLIAGVCLVAMWEVALLQRAYDLRVHGKMKPSHSYMMNGTSANDQELMRTTRMRALTIVLRNTAILLTIFWIAYSITFITGVLNTLHIHVHPALDVVGALLVKSQPLMDNIFVSRILRQIVSKLRPELAEAAAKARILAVKSHEIADAEINLSKRAMELLALRPLWGGADRLAVREENLRAFSYKGLNNVSGSFYSWAKSHSGRSARGSYKSSKSRTLAEDGTASYDVASVRGLRALSPVHLFMLFQQRFLGKAGVARADSGSVESPRSAHFDSPRSPRLSHQPASPTSPRDDDAGDMMPTAAAAAAAASGGEGRGDHVAVVMDTDGRSLPSTLDDRQAPQEGQDEEQAVKGDR